MAFFSAQTGSVSVKPSGGALATFDVSEWQLQEGNIIADVTTSAAAYTQGLATIQNHSWSFSLPVDSSNAPDASAKIPVGTTLSIWFKIGSTSTWHKLDLAIVESITPVNNNAGDAYRMTVSGRCGTLTYYTATAPA